MQSSIILDNYRLILGKWFEHYAADANKILYEMLIGDVPEIVLDNRLHIEVTTPVGIIINTIRIELNKTISKIKSVLIEKNPTFAYDKLCLFDGSKPSNNHEPLADSRKVTTDMKLILLHSNVPYTWKKNVMNKKHRGGICLTPRGFVTKNPSNLHEMVYYDKKGNNIGTHVPGGGFQIITGNMILRINGSQKQFYNLSTQKIQYATSSQYSKAVSLNNKYMCIAESTPYCLVMVDIGNDKTTEIKKIFGDDKLEYPGENTNIEFNASAISNDGKLIAVGMIGVQKNPMYKSHYVPKTYIINNGKYIHVTHWHFRGYSEINATSMYFSSCNKYLIIHGCSHKKDSGQVTYHGIFIHELGEYGYGNCTKIKFMQTTPLSYGMVTKGDYVAYFDIIQTDEGSCDGIFLHNIKTNVTYRKRYRIKE